MEISHKASLKELIKVAQIIERIQIRETKHGQLRFVIYDDKTGLMMLDTYSPSLVSVCLHLTAEEVLFFSVMLKNALAKLAAFKFHEGEDK